ncbi:response regulator [Leeia sp. TBRC 13508]|uniref:Response regulator n=1 Tax=Leeia speluncae TaxID=2884804 RepID=A0ABS8D6L0_9NEIS|nr:response regulator [Leeia speluncae]MCB6183829.1 response regulator [Leeia speluncae]
MRTPVILIVDDEPFNVEIICEYLSGLNCELITAEDGETAWRILESDPERFDLVVLDRMMPGIDGIEVLARIKANPKLKTLPVIMQTAAAAKEQVVEGLKLGAYYYLTKPYECDVLLAVIQTALADRFSHLSVVQQIHEERIILDLLKEGTFHVQTLLEAKRLSACIANITKNPAITALGLSELMINAVEHGNLNIGYDEKTRLMDEGTWSSEIDRRLSLDEHKNKRVSIQLKRDESSTTVLITDEGDGFDWEHYIEPSPQRAFDSHGRGIVLAKNLSFKSVTYLGKGNQVAVELDV